mmetsp:Transcript_50647/g.61069  ORF Transcript_50647/g.61069 Transcript_50647/m.61069 type:complete len:117 (+) Transcript_50647:126-476(+)
MNKQMTKTSHQTMHHLRPVTHKIQCHHPILMPSHKMTRRLILEEASGSNAGCSPSSWSLLLLSSKEGAFETPPVSTSDDDNYGRIVEGASSHVPSIVKRIIVFDRRRRKRRTRPGG